MASLEIDYHFMMLSVHLRRFIAVAALAVVALMVPANRVHADAIVATEATTATTVVEIFIEDGEIRVELETGVPDLVVFNGIFPDDFRVRMGLESEPEEDLRKRFFSEDFVIRADGGPSLPARLVSFETRRRVSRDEITGEPLPTDNGQGRRVVVVVFSYELQGRPEAVTITPPTGREPAPASSLGFITYHMGLPVMDFSPLEKEETLDLDWQDPWFSTVGKSGPSRRHDSPLNVFFYVEPFEVRVEVITRLRDLEAWIDLGVENLETIPVKIQADIMQKVADFLSGCFDLVIDDEIVVPLLDRVGFVERRLRTPSVIAPPRELDADSATLGVIFLQPMTGYPNEATVTWKLFPESVDRVSGAVTDAAGSLPVVLQPGANELCWETSFVGPVSPAMVDVWPVPSMFGRVTMWISWIALAVVAVLVLAFGSRAAGGGVPWARVGVLALVASGMATASWIATRSALIDEARASEVVSALLNNVYRAFDVRDEGLVNEILGRSISGDLLNEVSVEIRRGLTLAGEGGVRAKVDEVDLEDLTLLESDDGIAVRCTWVVSSSMGHWGHIHQRRNRYVADLRIEDIDGVWRITAMELIGEERV